MSTYFMMLWAGSVMAIAACTNNPSEHIKKQSVTHVKQRTEKRSVAKEWLIIPGKSVGKTTINEDVLEVTKRLGKPDASDAGMGKSLMIWYAGHNKDAHQTAIFSSRQMGTDDETSRVKQIRITSPEFMTVNGIHTGSALGQINAVFKTRKAAYYTKGDIYETKQGISFEINPAENCIAIVVQEQGSKRGSEAYLPFYESLYWY